MSWKSGKTLLAPAKFLALALALGFSSMLISFLVVYHLGRDLSRENAADPALLHRARILRTFTNELAALCNEYAKRVPERPGDLTTVNRRWVERVFRREIQFLEQRMNDTTLRDVEVYQQLQSSATRCAAMARYPGDSLLREQTLRDAARAARAVEAFIDRIAGASPVGPPRVAVKFGG